VPDASIIEPNPYLIYDSAHVETRSSGKQKINFTSWANSYLQAFKRHTGKYTEHTGYGAYVPNTTCGFMSLPFTLWNPDAPIIGTDFSGLLDLAGITLPPGHKTSFPARRGYNQVLDKCWEGLSELPNPFTICRDTYSTTKIKFLDNNYSYGVDKSCSGPVRTKGFLEYDDVANYYYTGQLQILQNSGWYIRLKQYFETENINYYYKKRGITIENMEVFKKTGIRSFNITGCTDVMDRAFITSLPTTTI
jgi:hypothetical protein